jgi:hypothetical protein
MNSNVSGMDPVRNNTTGNVGDNNTPPNTPKDLSSIWINMKDDIDYRYDIKPAQVFGRQEWKEYKSGDEPSSSLPRRTVMELIRPSGLWVSNYDSLDHIGVVSARKSINS